ncbi:MAG TPA: TonB-dependent receptor [Gemmatimonadaceae bacterium]
MRISVVGRYLSIGLMLAAASVTASAQGTIRGSVTDADGRPAPGATVHVVGTQLGALVDSSGMYHVNGIPVGTAMIRVLRLGFAPDSATIQIANGRTVQHDVRLHASAEMLGSVVVNAQRLGETQASALERRAEAPNVVNVLAGDVIRALPNANAAEAAGRIPGVSTERDEGEGKFIQVRGTEPRLTNVTINGAPVPGSEAGTRVPRLDDVPSDVLAAIEVSKTLTADMDADAIGGSVNLVTKTPEGDPKGYISGQYGKISLLNKNQYQEGFAYGGRFGADRRLGFLLGGSADRNNRTSNDLEPAWAVDESGRAVPIEWSQRDYEYRRNRYGLGGDLDYRFENGSAISLKGLYSRFEDFGTTYTNDVTTGVTSSSFGSFGDSAGTGAHGYGTGAEATRMSYNRTPIGQLYGGTLGGRTTWHGIDAKLSVNAAGTTSNLTDYRFSPFVYDGPNGQGLTVAYDASNTKVPTYKFSDPAMTSAAATPDNFALSHYFSIDGTTTGRDLGTALDLSTPWHATGGSWSSLLKFGGKVRDERKVYTRNGGFWFTDTPIALSPLLGNFSDPHYYSSASNAFTFGPMPNDPAARRAENQNAASFVNGSDTVQNTLASFNGSERIYAAYVSNTMNSGPFEIYLGLRMENTHSNYTGHVVTLDTSGTVTGISKVPGSQTYTDLFPSVQLKYSFGPRTDARVAVTRGIARPDYSSLAPSLQGTLGGSQSNPANLTTGNPDLKPQHAWNYDLLVEHFFPSVGVLSGGVFYEQLSDFIYNQTFTYNGPVTAFNGQLGTRPQNGGAGRLLGFEGEWNQRLVFLPGVFAGLGFDANFTHVDSRALVDPTNGRYAPLQRQSPNLANVALTYDFGSVSARAGWAYQGANITTYGDGSATPTGDTYFYAHSQVDASIIYNFNTRLQVQLQGLNLNNAVFGLFTGTPGHDYSIQREYYGSTIYLGAKYNI